MKRTELVPGEDYYFNRGQRWENGGGWGEQRLTVLSLDKVEPSHSYTRRLREFTIFDGSTVEADAYPGGSGVLVRDEKGKVFVVSLGQLRGPWEETKARVDANTKVRRDAADAKKARERAEEARIEAVAERIRKLGLDPGSPHRANYSNGVVSSLKVDALEALVDAAERVYKVGV